MALKLFLLLIFLTKTHVFSVPQYDFMGCYQDLQTEKIIKYNDQNTYTPKICMSKCLADYYRYGLISRQNKCFCTNLLGEQKSTELCDKYCPDYPDCNLRESLKDVYFTGLTVLGPPSKINVTNVTDTELHIQWEPPDYTKDLINYKIVAKSVKSNSRKKLKSRSWEFTNETLHNELSSLHPGTTYNISISGVSLNGPGIPIYQIIETKIGDPSEAPSQPTIISRDGMTMKVRLQPVENDNGPISSYLIIVVDKNSLQAVETEDLKGIREASIDGSSAYITAELQKEKVKEDMEFIIGDGQTYGRYYNAPLDIKNPYSVLLGVSSRKNGLEKRLFSEQTDNIHIVPYVEKNDDTPGIMIALLIGIVIISLLLIAGIIAFCILRQRINNRFRHRLQDVQELTIQGPMIDIENAAYVSEEQDEPINHYKNLKGQVWMIPHNSLNVDSTLILGEGKYGHIHKGILEKDNSLVTVSVYNIADRRLTHDQKHNMLKDMDTTIKCGKSRNVLEFIGTCENIDTVSVVFENSSLTLKEFLIGSRIPSAEKFTTMSETQAINFCIDIANGMSYLHSKKIIHQQICARHIAITNGNIPKITGFGLTSFYKDGKSPNCLRWTAREVLKGQTCTFKGDIWSYGCLIWEICTLGATPYTRIPNNDFSDRIIKGLILERPIYMDESLYQILLNCWQMNLDERPTFRNLVEDLEILRDDRFAMYLSFKLFSGFKYEPLQLNQELNNSVY